MLLISRFIDLWKILMFDWYTVVSSFFDHQLPPLAPNIFSCFSNHQGAVFFFFLLLSLLSSVLQWHHDGGNLFSEYDQSNWLFYVSYYLDMSSLLLCVQQTYSLKIMLKRRKESDTYLAADSRHCRSLQIAMKVDKVCSFQPALRPSSAEEDSRWRLQCRLKATHFIHFHRDLRTLAMSTVSSQVGVTLFPSF